MLKLFALATKSESVDKVGNVQPASKYRSNAFMQVAGMTSTTFRSQKRNRLSLHLITSARL